MKKYTPLDLAGISTCSIKTRDKKVNIAESFTEEPQAGSSFGDFFPACLTCSKLKPCAEWFLP